MTPGHPRGHDGPVPPDPLAASRFRARLAAAGRPAVAALVAGVLGLAVSAALLVAALGTPSDGTIVPLQRGAISAADVQVDAKAAGPLRDGDRVGAIDGAPLRGNDRPAAEEGDRLTYAVGRDGSRREVDVTIRSRPVFGSAGQDWGGIVLVPALAVIGALLLWRRPDLPATRALFLLGTLSCPAWLLQTLGPSPLDIVEGRWWFLVGGAALLLCESALLHFVLVFPSPPSRFHRALVAAVYGVPFALHVLDAVVSASGESGLAALGVWMTPRLEPLLVVATLAVPIARLRRTTDELARRQLRIVGLQLLASGAVYGLVFALPGALGGDPILPFAFAGVSFWPFPVVLAIAVLRFDLFELRLIAHRSLLYGLLTAAVVAIYAAVVGLLSAVTGEHVGFAASAAAAGIVAVAVAPLRAGLQTVVDRVVYGQAAEPYEVLTELGRRLEDRAQPDAVLDAVVETVGRSLSRGYVAIEVPDGGGGHEVAACVGEPTEDVLTVPLLHQRAEVGRLVVGLRHPGEQLGPTEQRLLAGLAGHVGTALAAARLTLDLQRSRERLVVALEDERRRVGRDLHDGLGPRLAAAAMTLEAAGRMMARDTETALALHDDVRAELTGVIGDVRRLVYALRPPALDQLGLVGALGEQANRLAGTDLSVVVDGDLPELPAAVEVAAYRIASEAMTNAVRHAGAGTVRVALHATDVLTLEVVDDGAGLPADVVDGVGVASMRERAHELGGTLSLGPGAEGGTRVVARLPLEA
jgi:signal transduction histidine kinase